MANKTGTVKQDIVVGMSIEDVQKKVKQMQSYLNTLKLPDDLAKIADSLFGDLDKKFSDFSKKKEQGFSTQAEINNFKKLGATITSSVGDIGKLFKELGNIGISDTFTATSEQITNLKNQIKSLYESIQQDSSVSTATGIYNKTVSGLKTPSVRVNAFSDAIKSGDIDQISSSYEKLASTATAIIARSKEGSEASKRWSDILNTATGVNTAYENAIKGVDGELKVLGDQLKNEVNIELEKQKTSFQDASSGAVQLQKDTKDITSAEVDMAKETYSLQNQMQSLADRFLQFTSITGMITLLGRAVRSAYNDVKDLDEAMNSIAVVTDYTTGELWDQVDSYNAVATSMGSSIKGAYEVARLYYQQGRNTAEVAKLQEETLKLARIAGIDYANATDYMTVALNGFGIAVEDSGKIVDVYSNLAAKAAVDQQELAEAMSKTASLASNVGMSFETTSAFLTQIIETTREAPETAGTALKTILARFSEVKKLMSEGLTSGADTEGEAIDINKIDTALKSVGSSLTDSSGKMRNMDEVLLELAGKWDTLDIMTQRYIATTAAGSRQQSRFLAMMSNYKRTMELVGYATDSAGASDEQFAKTQESLESKLNALDNAWTAFTTSIANSDVIKGAVDLLTKLIQGINVLTDAFGPLSGAVKTVLAISALTFGGSVVKGLLDAAAAAKRTTGEIIGLKGALGGIKTGASKWVGSIGGSIGKVSSAFQTIKSQFTAISDLKKIGGLGDKLLNLDAAEEDVTNLVSYGEELVRQHNLSNTAQQIGNVLGKENLGVEAAIDVVKTSQIAKEKLLNTLKIAGVALGVAAVAGVIALAVHMGKVNSYEYKSKKLAEEREKTESKISGIEEEIANFKDKYNGKAINADEQARLQILNEQLKVQQEQLKIQQQQQFELDQSKENKVYYTGVTPEFGEGGQTGGLGGGIGVKTTATGDVNTINETTRVITEQIQKQAELKKLMDDEKDPKKWEQYNKQYQDIQTAKEANYESLVSSANNLTTAQEAGLTLTKEETEAIGTATQYITDNKDQIYEYAGAVDNAKVSISAIAKELNGFQESVSSIGEALAAFQEDGQVSIDVLNKIGENGAFKDIKDQVNDFIQVLGDSNSTQAEAQEAADNLVTAYLDSSSVLENLTDDTQNLYITQLKAMGITNADAIVMQELNDIKAQAAVNSIDFQNATGADIVQLYNEANAAGYTTLALTNALLAKISMQNSGLDLSGQESALLGLASSADISAEALIIVNNMLHAIGKIKQATATGDLRMGQGYTAYLEGQKRRLNDLLKDGKGTTGNVTPTFSGASYAAKSSSGSSDSGSSSSASEKEEAKAKLSLFYNYEQAINKANDALEQLKNTEETLADADDITKNLQSQVDAYKNLIAINKEYLNAVNSEISNQRSIGGQYSDYLTFASDGTIRLLSSYYSLTGDIVEEIEDWISNYEELIDKQKDLNDEQLKYQQDLSDAFEDWRDNYIDLVDQLADIYEQQDKDELDRKKDYYDKLKEQDQDYLDSLKENINERRKARDRENTQEDLSQKQRRLALLQRDTSGLYSGEIQSLQEEIKNQQQEMEDTAVDDQISLLEKEFDTRHQEYELTIEKMEDQIQVNKDTNKYINQAESTIAKGFVEVIGVIKSGQDYKGASGAEQDKIIQDLNATAGGAYQYKQSGGSSVDTGKDYANKITQSSSQTSAPATTPAPEPASSGNGDLAGLNGNWILSRYNRWSNDTNNVKALQRGINNMIDDGIITGISKLLVDGDFGDNTDAAVRALQSILGVQVDGEFGRKTAGAIHSRFPKYANGGYVDFTGPAWVDGTKTKPEAFLSAVDTANIEKLLSALRSVFSNKVDFSYGAQGYQDNLSTGDFTIYVNVDSIANDEEIKKAISKVKNEILSSSKYRNVNIVNNIR